MQEITEFADSPSPRKGFKYKFSNFIYHNKWWLGIFTAIFAIFCFLIVNYFMKVKSDLCILIVIPNTAVQEISSEIAAYFKEFTPDLNNDGKIIVSYMYIPVSSELDSNAQITMANMQNLSVQMSTYDNLIVIADNFFDEYYQSKSIMYDLKLDYKDTNFIENYKILLSETDLKDKLGYSYYFTDDAYIGIRRSNDKNFTEQYNILKAIIDDLSQN
jgi:hypothetical protein